MLFDLSGRKIWVAGHHGMVGSALVRRLQTETCEIITTEKSELNLLRQREVEEWLNHTKPEAVFMAAARVGGIEANNTRPAEFLYENIAIQTHVIHGSYKAGVKKLVFLGSSCIYPKFAPQPISEDALLTGALEPTNQWYAIAKIAGLKMCQAYRRQYGCDFISVMPTNLYGPNDNYEPGSSHVAAALLMKIHQARVNNQSCVTIWGTGKPLREFMHVDDLADALVFLLKHYSEEAHINAGSGKEISVLRLAEMIADIVGYKGKFEFDTSKPDGTPRKLMDSSRLRTMGWKPEYDLRSGLSQTYSWYQKHSGELPV